MSTPETFAIEKYSEALSKDPNSQVFAPLAEAYRKAGMLKKADDVARHGLQRHPRFAPGLIVYAKIQKDLKQYDIALKVLNEALSLVPENILAQQLIGEIFLEQKKLKEALRAFKMVLFINPLAEKARKIVNKLESLTADEYEDDLFQMTKLSPIKLEAPSAQVPGKTEPVSASAPAEQAKALVRMLSLIDAFIVRNDIPQARNLLSETQKEFGDHPEIQHRLLLIQKRSAAQMAAVNELATPLKPIASRENMARDKKVKALETLLRRIKDIQA